jgi:putative transposase
MAAYIDSHRDEFGVGRICTALQVAPSTYYAAKSRPLSPRAVRDLVLIPILVAIWAANYRVYGAHKLWKAARRAGHDLGRDQVARLMRVAGIEGVRRSRRVRTTRSDPSAPRPADLVCRDFTATAPNQLWVTDLTYVATWAGVAYVCFIVDAFSRMIVGWRVASNMRTDMVLDALEMARWSRGTRLEGLVTHSDAGSQGGIKGSSQHLEMEVMRDGHEAATAGSDSRAAREDLVAGSAFDSATRRPRAFLGGDRSRPVERGRGRRGRCGIRGWDAMVPSGWRDAVSDVGPGVGPLLVLC